MSLNIISTKELRENFDQLLAAMADGQSLTLMYRSKPLAEIKPIKTASPFFGRSFSQKRINQWLENDRLTKKQQQQINELINRLP